VPPQIIHIMLPEEQELARLTDEQENLEEQVIQGELSLETERSEAQHFRKRYYETVGKLYVDLDQIEAQLAQTLATKATREVERSTSSGEKEIARDTADKAETAAQRAREQAEESSKEAGIAASIAPAIKVTAELKSAYRKACKLVHPDRATNDTERSRRTRYMASINVAYERGDLIDIERLTLEFGADPEAVLGNDIGMQMVKSIRRIAQLRRRLTEIDIGRQSLREDELYQLKVAVLDSEEMGGNPLQELAASLLQKISEQKITLAMAMQVTHDR
jgi:hypothetical protein